jgi:hypothetical protein
LQGDSKHSSKITMSSSSGEGHCSTESYLSVRYI